MQQPVPTPIFTLLNHSLQPDLQTLELKTSLQIPNFHIIGLPGPEVAEARDRVKSALESCGFEFPRKKIVLNLSPSSVRKQGTGMDLAMAIAIAASVWSIEEPVFAWGELGLDGTVKGGTHAFRALDAALRSSATIAYFPLADLETVQKEKRLLRALLARYPHRRGMLVRGVRHLDEVLDALSLESVRKIRENCTVLEIPEITPALPEASLPGVALPSHLQRWVGVASCGRHHLFLSGPRGTGKSLAIEWLEALAPPPAAETELEKVLIRELRGSAVRDESSTRRVGTQVRPPALYGGIHSGVLRPGEFTLAHGGILIADEFPEWTRDSRECFREPLERGKVTLSRVGQTLELPADFQLAANGNLCPCGGEYSENTTHLSLRCQCLPQDRHRYLQKISGPILDRIDLVYRVPSPRAKKASPRALPPDELVKKVRTVRASLESRYGRPPGVLNGAELEAILEKDSTLQKRLDRFAFSSYRERHRALRASLTLAEWDGCPAPDETHLHELMLLREAFFKRTD